MKRMGRFQVSLRSLERLLNIPPCHRIVNIWQSHEQVGKMGEENYTPTFWVAVEGPTLPEKEEGSVIKVVNMKRITEFTET